MSVLLWCLCFNHDTCNLLTANLVWWDRVFNGTFVSIDIFIWKFYIWTVCDLLGDLSNSFALFDSHPSHGYHRKWLPQLGCFCWKIFGHWQTLQVTLLTKMIHNKIWIESFNFRNHRGSYQQGCTPKRTNIYIILILAFTICFNIPSFWELRAVRVENFQPHFGNVSQGKK